MIVAVLLSAMVLLGWTFISDKYFPAPKPAKPVITAPAAPGVAASSVTTGASVPGVTATTVIADRGKVIAASPRVAIVTPRLLGSINLKGARFDDLVLPTYRVTIDKGSPPVRLLSPSGTADAYFGQFGWTGAGAPPADALWTASAPRLTPEAPVTLSWTSPTGVVFEQVVAIDKDFLFTVRQRVRNLGSAPLALQPWGLVSRLGTGTEKNASNLHVGPIGVMDGTLRDSEVNYDKLVDKGPQLYQTTGGWLGITEKYWLAALIPDQKS
ncbi:MAG: membrane protein insertase YidC, partial [Sandarakinorhabdus sp.]|nr:membrane protein insertase YidC [Sandarakinorhabdus sp.]